jgi:hypothetical protein
MPVVQLVEIYLAAECVPVNSEQACGSRLIAARPVQNALDEFLLKFVDGLIKLDSTFHHLPDKSFQLIFQGCTLRAISIYSWKYQLDLLEFVAC